MTIRTGFIGLGNQGKPIAAHLAPAGFEMTVYDIAEEPVAELVADGAKAAASPREVGQNADVVGICVPEDKHVRAVVFGDDGLLAGLGEGSVILIHSTILPSTAEEISEAAAAKNIEVMDACVTGGAARAETKELTLLIGGPESAPGEMPALLQGDHRRRPDSRRSARVRRKAQAVHQPHHVHPMGCSF